MPQDQAKSWQMRQMTPDEVDRIAEIDVSETGDVVYKWIDGKAVATPERWARPASYGDRWRELARWTRERVLAGGVAFGAFAGDRLVGFIALQYRLAEDVALLAALWVSRELRRQGVAAALTRQVVRAAEESGATAIYVSGAPTESAQGFYRSQGFRPTPFVHMEMYQREPEDIHMVKPL